MANENIDILTIRNERSIAALTLYKNSHLSGSSNKTRAMCELIMGLSGIHGIIVPDLEFTSDGNNKHSFRSSYDPIRHKITMRGKLSIITLLHEFAHALELTEDEAYEWSKKLFKTVYPKAFFKLKKQGNLLVVDNKCKTEQLRLSNMYYNNEVWE